MTRGDDLYRLPDPTDRSRRLRKESVVLPLLLFLFLAGAVAQWCAGRLGFHPALGAPFLWPPKVDPRFLLVGAAGAALLAVTALLVPAKRRVAIVLAPLAFGLFGLSRGPLYAPWALIPWMLRLRRLEAAQGLLATARLLLGIDLGVSLAVFLLLRLRLAAAIDQRADTHGSARWADEKDLQRTGLPVPEAPGELAPGQGIFLGLWAPPSGRPPVSLVSRDDDTHALVLAPTRSGKGVGIVVPNLLLYEGPVFVLDIKRENWRLTAGYRASCLGQTPICIDPGSPDSAQYNPLFEVRRGPLEVRDAQNIADMLVDPDGNRQRDHWDRTSAHLLVALILHVLYAEDEKTLSRCAELLTRPGVTLETTLRQIVRTKHLGDRPHPLVAQAAQSVLNKSDNERSGVVSTALSFLSIYSDPLIARITARSDFRIDDLVESKPPLSLYLAVPPSDLTRARPLIRLLLNQFARRLTETLPAAPRPRLLMLLDEFPALGYLPFFEHALAFLAGYGIRVLLITQDLSQLRSAYGTNESIVSNCAHRVCFTPNRPETAEYLSRLLGQTTVHATRVAETSAAGPRSSSETRSPSDSQRPLLTSDEVLRFPPDDGILFAPASRPIRIRKLRYYEVKILAERARLTPPPLQPACSREPRHDWSDCRAELPAAEAQPPSFERLRRVERERS
jgi:type IV secretion system protein VirD4